MKTTPTDAPAPRAIGFRAPPDLAEWLRAQARENSRTVSNQTVWLLQQYRKQQEAQGAPQT